MATHKKRNHKSNNSYRGRTRFQAWIEQGQPEQPESTIAVAASLVTERPRSHTELFQSNMAIIAERQAAEAEASAAKISKFVPKRDVVVRWWAERVNRRAQTSSELAA